MLRYILTVLLSLCLVPMVGSATTYQARVDKSIWNVNNAKLSCQISHPIPGFGEARFMQYAGKSMQFQLEASERKQPKLAKLFVFSPHWYKTQKPERLLTFKSKAGFVMADFKKSTPREMTAQLINGMHLKFKFYKKQQNSMDNIILSPVNFKPAYQEFTQCLSELVPYTYEELRKTTVNFVSGSLAIKPEDKKVLDAIADMVASDPDITRVHITGHSDTLGNYRDNRDLALQRMWKVKDYLVFHGVNPDIITQKGHADAKPVASNKTAKGRAKNRRAEIVLYR